ncbi:MAG: DUF5916 domain-containing protein [Vicinamibacterales bacterium]
MSGLFSLVQAQPSQVEAEEAGPTIDGPPPPILPTMMARDSQGRVTLRATRLKQALVLDGSLDEEVYLAVPPVGDFIQQEPREGTPASERTDVWVFFDDDNVYVSARIWMSQPEGMIVNEMRRDDGNIWRTNDSIGVVFDTFYDRRSGYYVNTNALGAVRDGFLLDEHRNANIDFNFVWDVRSRRLQDGWSTEIVIPFKSIRYPSGSRQVWGFNVQRVDRTSNELSYLSPVPASYGGPGIWKMSSAATLVGIEAPASGGGILDVKPYALSTFSGGPALGARDDNVNGEIGGEAKYKITKSLNVDFTYNTDFAQVEADTQQLNLTRFSLFFPEKREFFLEGQSNFNFGTTFGTARPGGDQNPIVFFSRQIGIANGLPVPIAGGGRVTGRIGAFNVGALSIRTRESDDADVDATTFSVVRVRRDVLQRSTIGMIATDRRYGGVDAASNQVIGADAAFRLFQDVEVNANYLRSRTTDVEGDGESYAGQFRYSGDLYGVEAARLKVGDAFQPGIGFVSRTGIVRNFGFLRYSPRPARFSSVRKLSWEATYDDIAGTTGGRQTLAANGTFRIQANSGDELSLAYTHNEDRPRATFTVAGAPIAPGDYQFGETKLSYILGPLRPLVGTASVGYGGFYGGTKTEVAYNGRVPVTSQLSFEPTLTLTWLDMPDAAYRAQVVSTRTIYTITPRMMTSALFQFSSTAGVLATNARFMWEYRPGSELFLVYSDGRDTEGRGFPDLLNRSFAIKMTRLFQF